MINHEAIFNAGFDDEQSTEKFFKDDESVILGDVRSINRGERRILFVTGLSGSGKSTLTDKYLKEVIPLDYYWMDLDQFRVIHEYSPKTVKELFGEITWDFLKKNPYGKDLKKGLLYNDTYMEYIDWVIAHEDDIPIGRPLIVEGIQILDFPFDDVLNRKESNKVLDYRMKELLKFPIIILGTSVKTSTKQAYNRYFEKTEDKPSEQKQRNRLAEFLRVAKMNVRLEIKKTKILKFLKKNPS